MKTKIRIFCWWTNDQQSVVNRTLTQLNINDFLEKYEFVYDDTYEWAIVYGKLTEPIHTDKQHTIFFGMEPTWSHNIDRNAVDYSDWIFVQNRNIFDHDNEKVFEGPNYMLYGGGGDHQWGLDCIKNWNLTKTKTISMVVSNTPSNMWWVPQNAPHLYNKRMDIANLIIQNNLPVDIYGKQWQPIGQCKGEISNKNEALLSYKFSIGIENTSEPFYTTEKFTDCLMTNTIPVYFGSTNISEYYDNRGYIQIHNLEDLENVKNTIISIENNADELYQDMLPFCIKNKNIFLENFNILNKIDQVIKGIILK